MTLTFFALLACSLASYALPARAAETAAAEPTAPRDKNTALFFQKLKKGEKQTVVTYGTSLTQGGAWVPMLKAWFDTKYPDQVTLINSGMPGRNSDNGRQNVQSKVVAHAPDLVFIEFAYNDAHEKFKMPVERGASNLEKIVTAIRTANPNVAIVLQTMNVPWDKPNAGGTTRSAAARAGLQAFNDNYRNYARAHDTELLDHYIAWKQWQETDPPAYQASVSDGTHPNKIGIEHATWPLLKSWLESNAR